MNFLDYHENFSGAVLYIIRVTTNIREFTVEKRYSEILAWKTHGPLSLVGGCLQLTQDLPKFPGKIGSNPTNRLTKFQNFFDEIFKRQDLDFAQREFTDWLIPLERMAASTPLIPLPDVTSSRRPGQLPAHSVYPRRIHERSLLG